MQGALRATGPTATTGGPGRRRSTGSRSSAPRSTASASTSSTCARRTTTRCRSSSATAGRARSSSSTRSSSRSPIRPRTAATRPTRSTSSRPSLPGYGFSDKPTAPGWDVTRIADGLRRADGPARLRPLRGTGRRLGGDGHLRDRLAATPSTSPASTSTCRSSSPRSTDDITEQEQAALDAMTHYQTVGGRATRPSRRPGRRPLGYGLVDSPAGQAAWIVEKFWAWTDCDGHPENVLTRDELLDNVMLYWAARHRARRRPGSTGRASGSRTSPRSRCRSAARSSPRRSSARRADGPRAGSRTCASGASPTRAATSPPSSSPSASCRTCGSASARCADQALDQRASCRPERDGLRGRVVAPQPGRQQDRVGELARVVVLAGRHREVRQDREREARPPTPPAGVARRAAPAGGRPRSMTIVPSHVNDRQQHQRRVPAQHVAAAGPVHRLPHVEGRRLVLHLLGEVPQEQRGGHRLGAVEELARVALGPAGERVGDRLRGRREGEVEAEAAAALDPARRPGPSSARAGRSPGQRVDQQVVEAAGAGRGAAPPGGGTPRPRRGAAARAVGSAARVPARSTARRAA